MITKPFLQRVREDIDEALRGVAEKHNLSFKTGRCTYRESSFSMKLDAALVSDDGVVQSPARTEYEQYCEVLDLKPEWLDEWFLVQGKRYKVTGLKMSRHKYPVAAVRDDGREFKFGADTVRRAMGG